MHSDGMERPSRGAHASPADEATSLVALSSLTSGP